jgi:hypothetical protein
MHQSAIAAFQITDAPLERLWAALERRKFAIRRTGSKVVVEAAKGGPEGRESAADAELGL